MLRYLKQCATRHRRRILHYFVLRTEPKEDVKYLSLEAARFDRKRSRAIQPNVKIGFQLAFPYDSL